MEESEKEEKVSEGLVTVRKASNFLGIGRSKLYELMDAGDLPYVRLGRARRIPIRAMRELAAANLTIAT